MQKAYHPFWLWVDVPQTAYLKIACKVVLKCNLQFTEVFECLQRLQLVRASSDEPQEDRMPNRVEERSCGDLVSWKPSPEVDKRYQSQDASSERPWEAAHTWCFGVGLACWAWDLARRLPGVYNLCTCGTGLLLVQTQ